MRNETLSVLYFAPYKCILLLLLLLLSLLILCQTNLKLTCQLLNLKIILPVIMLVVFERKQTLKDAHFVYEQTPHKLQSTIFGSFCQVLKGTNSEWQKQWYKDGGKSLNLANLLTNIKGPCSCSLNFFNSQ